MIDIESLSKSFGPRTLWSDVDLTIHSRQMIALTGPSGSGKSTLLNCIGLLDAPTSGVIRHQGKEITRLGPRQARLFRRDVLGYLFQDYALIDNATVTANLEVAARPRRGTRRALKAAIPEALDRVGLAGRERERVSRLSGGEQQRVALARLMVKQPSLILADEPTGALDHENASSIVKILRDLSDSGCAVVVATHDDYVRDQCDTAFQVGSR
ncbi:ATP-binding cassette domain-containing protein [Streptomyces decoyicus]|uniref:ATP-binding cassette domain-containing protein n=1 Tax=Streptomyces decoyicus TaxID=249567 RepID=A0ABZ1F8N0_9ACTN|nr:ATP-binding cassette domain-containing protein [Streptomyces decoyicus]WSB66673.1 ATP-binding cassette domain-containing protein [Streptomyces decoyicus]